MTLRVISREYVLPEEPKDYMGEVRVPVLFENYDDLRDVQRGRIAADGVRRVEMDVVVDTGASGLVLPQEVVERLGLEPIRTTQVVYADDRVEERPVAGVVQVTVAGRSARVDCVVGPPGSEALLGQIVLEITDLLVDRPRQRLVPNPASPYMTRYMLR